MLRWREKESEIRPHKPHIIMRNISMADQKAILVFTETSFHSTNLQFSLGEKRDEKCCREKRETNNKRNSIFSFSRLHSKTIQSNMKTTTFNIHKNGGISVSKMLRYQRCQDIAPTCRLVDPRKIEALNRLGQGAGSIKCGRRNDEAPFLSPACFCLLQFK